METKELKIIDKEYLKNTIINLDKSFLSKKYALITETEAIENKIKKIIGTNNSEQLENPNIDDIIGIRINNINKISKHFVEQLPNPNEADENGLYIIQDKNSIDEVCKFFVCIVVIQDGLKKWAIISSPSPILETEDINFEEEFGYCDNKMIIIGKKSFYNFQELKTYVDEKNIGQSIRTENEGEINGNYYEFFYKIDNKVKVIDVLVGNNGNLYFKYKGQAFYKEEQDNFAQSVINPEGDEQTNNEGNESNEQTNNEGNESNEQTNNEQNNDNEQTNNEGNEDTEQNNDTTENGGNNK